MVCYVSVFPSCWKRSFLVLAKIYLNHYGEGISTVFKKFYVTLFYFFLFYNRFFSRNVQQSFIRYFLNRIPELLHRFQRNILCIYIIHIYVSILYTFKNAAQYVKLIYMQKVTVTVQTVSIHHPIYFEALSSNYLLFGILVQN